MLSQLPSKRVSLGRLAAVTGLFAIWRALQRQVQLSEMKSNFVSSVSHELRTPLTALRGEAEVMLLQPHPVQEYRRLLASHLEEYDRLTRLINRLLTLARAEAGDIPMHLESVDLAQLTGYLIEQLETVAPVRMVPTGHEIPPAGPVPGRNAWRARITGRATT